MLLEKLAIPRFESRIIEEINSSRDFYNRINQMDIPNMDKLQKKKKIISDSIFDMFVGMFDLGYDLKIKYINNNETDTIYINIKGDFDDIFYQVYGQCFFKYLSKIHLLKDNRIDKETYKLARMAVLNKDKNILKKLADSVYLSLIETSEVESKININPITDEEIQQLNILEKQRRNALIGEVESYDFNNRLSNKDIRNVFSCLSSNVYYKLNCKQKAHVANLIYNYFSSKCPTDNRRKYAKLLNKSVSNRKCLEIVIGDLMLKGDSMMIKKKNFDLINDVCSGISCIYKNETDKSKLTAFDGINKINDKIKK